MSLNLYKENSPQAEQAEIFFIEGIDFISEREFEKAVIKINQAIQLDPKNPKYHYQKGNALFMMEEYEKAISEYDEAIQLDPKNPEYYYGKALTLRLLGRYDEAIKAVKEALNISRNDLSNLVLYLKLQADLNSSEEGFNMVKELILNDSIDSDGFCEKIYTELEHKDLDRKEEVDILKEVKDKLC